MIKCGENDPLVDDDDNNGNEDDDDDGEYIDAVCDVRNVFNSSYLWTFCVDYYIDFALSNP